MKGVINSPEVYILKQRDVHTSRSRQAFWTKSLSTTSAASIFLTCTAVKQNPIVDY